MSAEPQRSRLLRVLPILLLSAACSGTQAQSPISLEFIADANFATGTAFEELQTAGGRRGSEVDGNTPREVTIARKAKGGFGGISAIAYDDESGRLYALTDSSNSAVFVTSLEIADDALLLEPLDTIRLADVRGVPLPLWTLDPEGMALADNGDFYLASEGFVARQVLPGIFRFNAAGSMAETLPLPEAYLPAEGSGIRHNKGFEGLSLSPSGRFLFASLEGRLAQDTGSCEPRQGCLVRFLRYDLRGSSDEMPTEYFYRTDGSIISNLAVSEILAWDDNTLLVAERGWEQLADESYLQTIKLHLAEIPGTPSADPVEKQLVLDLKDVEQQFSEGFRSLDNYEGMCFGPRLQSGERTLLMVSDNNYNDRQRTSFLAFKIVQN